MHDAQYSQTKATSLSVSNLEGYRVHELSTETENILIHRRMEYELVLLLILVEL